MDYVTIQSRFPMANGIPSRSFHIFSLFCGKRCGKPFSSIPQNPFSHRMRQFSTAWYTQHVQAVQSPRPRGKKCGKSPCAKAEKLFFSPPSPGKKQESNPAWMNIHREMKDFAPHDGKTRPFIPRFSRTQSLMPPWVAGFSTVCTCPTTTTKNNISCHAVSERMIPCCFP